LHLVIRLLTKLALVSLASLLIALAFPRATAHIALAPGQRATELLLAGERVTPSGYERAVSALSHALTWVETGRWRIRLGIVQAMYAHFLPPEQAEPLLQEGVMQIFRGLAREPADSYGWLVLARLFYAAGEPLQAAGALEWATRTHTYDPDNATPRVVLGLELWEFLSERARQSVQADLLAWFHRASRDVVSLAIAADRVDLISGLLATAEGARERFARLLADLEKEAASKMPTVGGGS
jgi:hypothetical protein